MTNASDPRPPAPARHGAPVPLVVAGSLVVVEALLLTVQGLTELVALSGQRMVMGVSTALFFLLYGAGLAFCAWALIRRRSWARAPVVVAQLIQLAVAWSFRGGSTTPVAITLALVGVLVLAGVFHPAATDALADDES